MDKLIIGKKTTMNPVDISLSCKTYFVLGIDLHTVSEPKIEQEPEPERQSTANFFIEFRETIDGI